MAVTIEDIAQGTFLARGVATFVSTVVASSDVQLASASLLSWNVDTYLARLGAASLRQGNVPSATPVAQTLTLGEASRPGTDANVGGASGTLRSGLGTGTGTASSIALQTPTLAGAGTGTQAYATRLTVATAAITAAVPVLLADGDASSPSLGFTSNGGLGIFLVTPAANVFEMTASSVARMRVGPNNLVAAVPWYWGATTGAADAGLTRLAASSMAFAVAPSAAPSAVTLTVGDASRPGTDTDTGGGSGTLRSGLGTGTGAASSLILQTPTVAGAGTGTQSYTTRLTLVAAGATLTVPLLFSADNTLDIGATNATRPRSIYLATSLLIQSGANTLVSHGPTNLDHASGMLLRWSNSATAITTIDTGLARNGAGILEVNSGTAGTLRDLTLRSFQYSGGIKVSTSRSAMSGNLTLAFGDPTYQFLDPNGSNRDVTLPTAVTGISYVIDHIGGANTLTVKDAGASTIDTLAAGDIVTFVYDGTAWQVM